MNYPQEFIVAVRWNCEKDLFDIMLTDKDIAEIWDMTVRLLDKNQDTLDSQNDWNYLVYDAMVALDYELPEEDAI